METDIVLTPLTPADFPDGLGHLATNEHARAIRNLATSYRDELVAGADPDVAVDKSIRWGRDAGIPSTIAPYISLVALSELTTDPDGKWVYDLPAAA